MESVGKGVVRRKGKDRYYDREGVGMRARRKAAADGQREKQK